MTAFRLLPALLFITSSVWAQPFIDEIQEFKRQDSLSFPAKGITLFVGSSSFRLWQDVQAQFPTHVILNRGFGGSMLEDVIRYADQIIIPYEPKQIVIYCGENDIASGATSEKVAERFATLVSNIRSKLPKVKIIYVSAKPSPSRAQFQPLIIQANQLIKMQISKIRNARFVDVYTPMLTSKGEMRAELFGADQLHMNADGYAIWTTAIEPALDR